MWKSIADESFVLDIYDNTGYQGNVVTLTGGAHPFVTQEDDSEDYYTPIRTQSGNIEVLVTDPAVVNDLIPVKATDYQVVLRKDLGGGESEICWVGFISGEMFTQPWEPVPYVATIPVVSVMEAMRGVMFTQDEGISSLKSVMADVASHIHQIAPSMVYPTFCRADQVYVSNQNFREWVKPVTRENLGMGTDKYNCKSLYDVVEEFCKYFGVSLHEDAAQFVFAVHDYSEKQTTYPYYLDDFASALTFITNMTPEVLTPCGTDGTAGYTPAYRRVLGKFATGDGKGMDLFSVGNVWTDYPVYGVYSSRSSATYVRCAIFQGDTEVTPFISGAAGCGPLYTRGGALYGGQLAYIPGYGSGIWLLSIKDEVIHYAMTIKMERPMYVMYNNSVNIIFDLHAVDYQSVDNSGFTGKLYIQLKVTKADDSTEFYYLSSSTNSSGLISYGWVSAPQSPPTAVIPMKDGSVDKELVSSIIASVKDGMAFTFPTPMSGTILYGLYNIELTILCNAVPPSDYSGSETIKSTFIDRLDISYSVQPVEDFLSEQVGDENEYAVLNANDYQQNYDVDCSITDSRKATGGTYEYYVQFGTGIAMNSYYNYGALSHDHKGIVRRAALFVRPREVLTIPSRNRVGSYKNIQMGGQLFVLLARSTDWRDAKTTTKVLRVSLN